MALFIFGSKCINLYQRVSKFCEVKTRYYYNCTLCVCILTVLSHLIHFDPKMNSALTSQQKQRIGVLLLFELNDSYTNRKFTKNLSNVSKFIPCSEKGHFSQLGLIHVWVLINQLCESSSNWNSMVNNLQYQKFLKNIMIYQQSF